MADIIGTERSDYLWGTAESDTIRSLGGNDNIYGGSGDDIIDGGAGDDLIEDGFGNDVVYGGDGNDYFSNSDQGNDVLFGGRGADAFRVYREDVFGPDYVQIYAGGGNDSVMLENSGSSSFRISLGGGDDLLQISNAGFTAIDITLGDGRDRIVLPHFSVSNGIGLITVRDFNEGATGDVISPWSFLHSYLEGWDDGNPFSQGFLRLIQDGSDTIFQIDHNGGGDEYVDAIRLLDTDAMGLTTENFDGLPPDGSEVPYQTIIGTDYYDFIAGSARPDFVDAMGGDDHIFTGAGADLIYAGDGNDLIEDGSGSDIVYGGRGADRIDSYEGGNDVLYGEAGSDTIFVSRRADLPEEFVQVYAGGGNDSVRLALSNKTDMEVRLGGDDDELRIADLGLGNVRVTLGEGRDRIVFEGSAVRSEAQLTITDFDTGNDGDKIEVWSLIADILNATEGENPFATGYLVLAQEGSDTLLQLRADPESEFRTLLKFADTNADSFTTANFDGLPPDGSDVPPYDIIGTENYDYIIGTIRDDIIQGLAGQDTIYGDSGDDILYGGDGEDYLDGGTGTDIVYGGAGDDTLLSYDGLSDTLIGDAGRDFFQLFRPSDALQGFLQVYGGGGNDTLSLELYNDSDLLVRMGGGSDTIYTHGVGAGSSSVSLGADQDTIVLGSGLSNYRSALSVLDFEVGDAGDRLNIDQILEYSLVGLESANPFTTGHARLVQDGSSTLFQLDRDGGGDEYVTIIELCDVEMAALTAFNFDGVPPDGSDLPGITVVGDEYTDYLYGTERSDTLNGMGGNDRIFGYGGDDTIDGGNGDDFLADGLGSDTVYGGSGNDFFQSDESGDDVLFGGEGADTFIVTRSSGPLRDFIQIYAGAGDDTVRFRSYRNTVEEFTGNTLVANLGGGNDTITLEGISTGGSQLSLGEGQDTVIIRNLSRFESTGDFLISDFEAGQGGDRIEFATLANDLENWDGSTNPFAAGYLTLVEDESDVLVRINHDASGNDARTIARLSGVDVADLTAFNFGGFSPDGANPVGQTIEGTLYSETLIGTVGPDTIFGNSGNDTIEGGYGDDILWGGDGSDTIRDGTGDDVVYGENGDDYFDSQIGGNDVLFGGSGNDTFIVNRVANLNAEFIQVYAGAGDDYLYLQENGSDSSAVARMGGGDDRVEVMSFGDRGFTLTLGAGSDTIQLNYAANFVNARGNMVVTDFSVTDRIDLSDLLRNLQVYNDPFEGGYLRLVQVEDDVLLQLSEDGGLSGYSTALTLLNVNAADLTSSNFETLGTFEPIVTSQIAGTTEDDRIDGTEEADVVVGLGGNDTLFGGGGADTLYGGAGYDLLIGGLGNDLLDGGNGVDTASYEGETAGININLVSGRSTNRDGFVLDRLINIENVIGSNYDDDVVGDRNNNTLFGGEGDDFILEINSYSGGINRFFGGAGNDTMYSLYGTTSFYGGSGDDYFRGGVNVDEYIGGEGFDRVSFYNEEATQAVFVDLRTQIVTNDGFGNIEQMSGIEAIGGGTQFADELYGNDYDNLILGGDGGDILYGFAGDDRFQLGGTASFIDGGLGTDLVYFADQKLVADLDGDGAADTVERTEGVAVNLETGEILSDGFGDNGTVVNVENLGGTRSDDVLSGDHKNNSLEGFEGDDLLRGGSGNDLLDGGEGNDVLVGGIFSDTLIGGIGNDILEGGYGLDTLVGGIGQDLLSGGFGADTFVFAADDSRGGLADLDQILDFSQGEGDRIDLSAIDADASLEGAQAFVFVDDAAFSRTAGELRYSVDGQSTLIEADFDGDGVADFAILLNGSVSLESTDFIL
ncbi:calcium-binding protein [Erythrobacter litoralis]|uniref:calcium-binding protein n=1 Tax=Erythrobacter litoralis TaxID=39960 RepID=UPI002434E17F|nr:calcium-binding protein [Erythrobacter litoralis]